MRFPYLSRILLLALGLGGWLSLAGCATSGAQRIMAQINQEKADLPPGDYYAGTLDDHHYVRHLQPPFIWTYRIRASQMKIPDPFPFTADSSRWRKIQFP